MARVESLVGVQPLGCLGGQRPQGTHGTLKRELQRLAILGFALLLALAPRQAEAQVLAQQLRNDLPVIVRLSSAGVVPGRSAEITLFGDRLTDVHRILCEGGVELDGVVKAGAKETTIRLKVRPDAVPGIYPFHVLCKSGLSNPRMLRVDSLSQVVEQDAGQKKNDSVETAQRLAVPCAVSGTLTPVDQDYFEIEVAAGERLVFDVEAHRLGSPIRPVLTILDASGRTLAKAFTPDASIAPDVRLVHKFPSSGKYYVCVNDQTFSGTTELLTTYYLRIGPCAFATDMFPLGGRRGGNVSVTLRGGCLEAPLVHKVSLAGDVRWQQRRLVVPTPLGPISSPMSFAVGEYPEVVENEGNDDPKQAQPVTLPVTINGRMDKTRDRDCFRFKLKSQEAIRVRVLARSLGSRLDPVVSVRDPRGRDVITADDSALGGRVPPVIRPLRMNQTTDDPLFQFNSRGAGEYVISVDDRYYHGGEGHAYRLEIAPQRPDFELIMQPGRVVSANNNGRRAQQRARATGIFNGGGAGSLSIDRGGQGSLVVNVVRSGYTGPIRLVAEGLPKGLSVEETVIPAGRNQVEMSFAAGFDAESTAGFVRIYGTGQFDNQDIVREAEHPVIFSAMPQNSAPAMHTLDVVAIGISGQGAELALRGEISGPLAPGGKAKLKLLVRRRQGYDGEVAVRAVSLPSGFSLPQVKVPAGKDEVEVELTAGAQVTPGKRSLQLEGRLVRGAKGGSQTLVALAPVVVDVQPLLQLQLADKQIDVPRGGKTTIEIRITRNAGEGMPIELGVSRLPRGVTLGSTTIPSDAKTFALEIKADDDAAASPIRRIIQLQPKTKVGDKTLELPTLRFALKVTRS